MASAMNDDYVGGAPSFTNEQLRLFKHLNWHQRFMVALAWAGEREDVTGSEAAELAKVLRLTPEQQHAH